MMHNINFFFFCVCVCVCVPVPIYSVSGYDLGLGPAQCGGHHECRVLHRTQVAAQRCKRLGYHQVVWISNSLVVYLDNS